MDIAGGDPDDVAAVTVVGCAVEVGGGPVGHGAGWAGQMRVRGGGVAGHAGDIDRGGQGQLQGAGSFAEVDAAGDDVRRSPGGLVVGDLTDGGPQLVGRLDQVQVGAAGGGAQLGPPTGDVDSGLLGCVEGGGETVLVGVLVDVPGGGGGVQDNGGGGDAGLGAGGQQQVGGGRGGGQGPVGVDVPPDEGLLEPPRAVGTGHVFALDGGGVPVGDVGAGELLERGKPGDRVLPSGHGPALDG